MQACGESTDASHPQVGLLQNPVGADGVGKRVPAHTQFRDDNPRSSRFCGGRDCLFDEPPVLCEITRIWREMT